MRAERSEEDAEAAADAAEEQAQEDMRFALLDFTRGVWAAKRLQRYWRQRRSGRGVLRGSDGTFNVEQVLAGVVQSQGAILKAIGELDKRLQVIERRPAGPPRPPLSSSPYAVGGRPAPVISPLSGTAALTMTGPI